MKNEVVGYCGVDSGQLILCDPCYLLNTESQDLETMYNNIIEVTCKDKFAGQFGSPTHQHVGVAVSTGWGDGWYPVMVHRDSHGRIMRVAVEFDV